MGYSLLLRCKVCERNFNMSEILDFDTMYGEYKTLTIKCPYCKFTHITDLDLKSGETQGRVNHS